MTINKVACERWISVQSIEMAFYFSAKEYRQPQVRINLLSFKHFITYFFC